MNKGEEAVGINVRSRAVDLSKGIAIIGVVAHHIANRRFGESEREWIGLGGTIADWSVPLFVLISGYLSGLSGKRRGLSFVSYVESRFKRLIVPFAVVALLYSVVFEFIYVSGIFRGFSGGYVPWYKMWVGAFLGAGGGGEQLYFLPLLFLISFAAFPILLISRRSSGLGWAVVACLLLIALVIEPGRVIYYWTLKSYVAGVALFGLGFLFSDLFRWRWVPFVVASVICVGGVCLSDKFTFSFLYPCVLFFGFCVLDLKCDWLARIGSASGTVFLYHTPFLIQPLLILVAIGAPKWLHIIGAYIVMIGVIVVLTKTHEFLVKTRLRRLAY